jgi:hypothetical protein
MAKANVEAPKSPVIRMVKGAVPKFRKDSARDLYYRTYEAHAGKTLAEAEKAIAAKVPSMPKKGKLAGKPEPVSGWTRWFVRNGYITLEG